MIQGEFPVIFQLFADMRIEMNIFYIQKQSFKDFLANKCQKFCKSQGKTLNLNL